MEVNKTTMKRFISASDTVFVIPVYQRNYDWEREHCEELYNDIKNVINSENTHFLGTICFKMEGRSKIVIVDGQQRITSLTLLLKAIYDISDDNSLKSKIRDQYLINPYSSEELKLKLKPIKKDESVFIKLLSLSFSEDFLSKEEKESSIYKNYKLFKSLLKESIVQGINIADFVDTLERLEIVEIALTNENPQIIFESLNSTGKDLTNTDLLRNYLLMSLDYPLQEKLYNSYWLKIEELIRSENMETFIINYLIMKRKTVSVTEKGKRAHLSPKNLYYTFKKEYPDMIFDSTGEKIKEILKDMFKFANYFKHFLYTKTTNYSNLSPVDKKLYELMYLLDEKTASILLMYLYDKYSKGELDEKTFIELIDICISYSFRSKVVNRAGFTSQFAALTIQKLDPQPIDGKIINRFWGAITSGRGRQSFPRDDEFKEALIKNPIYTFLKSNGTKYLLYSLEKKSTHSKELPPFINGTVEHIMPQNLSVEWQNYLKSKKDIDSYDFLLHTLGNLTLTGYNSEISNSLFDNKRKEYSKSNYNLTKQLSKFSQWTSKEITRRAESLADQALLIWKMDEAYNNIRSIETGVTYNLQADFSAFIGTKPAVISVCDEEVIITKWTEFLIKVVVSFYQLEPSFIEQMKYYPEFPGKIPVISDQHEKMRRYYQINNNLYINLNQDTEAILQSIKCIVDFYDKKAGTNFIDEIWFTIRKKN